MKGLKVFTTVLLFLVILVGCREESTVNSPESQDVSLVSYQNDNSGVVPNQYIVVLKKGANPSQVANAHGLKAYRTFNYALNGFAVTIPNENALEGLRKNPNVDYIEPDLRMHAFAQSVPTGVDRIEADNTSSTGSVDVDIAIIDTGIDPDHPDLNVYTGIHYWTLTTGPPNGRGPKVDNNYADDNGHGTHVAGTAAAIDNSTGVVGVAPGVRLWAVKVLDANGSGYLSDIINGIDYVTQHADEIEVANMSLGGTGQSSAFREAIQNSVASGVVYIVAAGNDSRDVFGADGVFNTSDDILPASYPEVAAISAFVDTDGQPGGNGPSSNYGNDDYFASFSNYSGSEASGNPVNSSGAAIDLILPGVDIYSTYPGGYATMSGTSMASPHAAGLAALYIAKNGRATSASGVYSIRQGLIDEGIGMFSTNGLVYDNDPDNNNENLGWAGQTGPQPPVASAGSDVTVSDGDNNGSEQVTLDGSASYDPDGGNLTYQWSIGGEVKATTVTYTDTYYVSGSPYTVTLQVTDDEGTTATDDVIVTVNVNQSPVADAGSDQNVTDSDGDGSESVTLDGSSSSDPDGSIVSYEWYEGSTLLGTGQTLSYTFDIGTHNITLVVTDNGGTSDSDEMIVTVSEASEELTITGISPNYGYVPSTFDVTISGTGFQSGIEILFEKGIGSAPIASNVTVVSSTTITATIQIVDGGPPKTRVWDVKLTNPDGGTDKLYGAFTVYY
jgi:subtilisin family serine protease